MSLRFTLLAATALVGVEASAQTIPAPAADAPATVLDTVTSSATRTERSLFEIPATVTQIDEQAMERRGVGTVRDLLRYEPGVSIGNQPGRTGPTNYNIRGIGGNRVLLQIDGVRVPDFPGTNQGPGTYTRDFVDLESLKAVDIVRGPASALYGSDAIGGVVAYRTKDPADYLSFSGRDWYVGGRVGYDGADRSRTASTTAAARAGSFAMLATLTRRDGEEIRPNGSVAANPQDTRSENLLAKLVWTPTEVDTFRLTAEAFERTIGTDVRSELGLATGSTTTRITRSNADDASRRRRISLDHTHAAPFGFVDSLTWRAYYTWLDREEDQVQDRVSPTSVARRFTRNTFEQDVVGGEVQATSAFTTAEFGHTLTYGASLAGTWTSRPRDRYEVNLATGALTRVFSGGPGVPAEVFPNKNFPDTRTLQAGAYVQDEIAWGAIGIVPGVRVDHYRLDPDPDAAFATTNTQNFQVREARDTALSPKLGLTYQLSRQYILFGQYARGFRAPPYDDANIGFTNGPSRYEILPNPDLRPETSDSFEAGLRGRFGDGSSFSVSAFHNRYQDFIASRVVGVRNGFTQYQAQNVSEATIQGLEGRADWRFRPDWSLLTSAAWARGTDDTTDRPLDGVSPFTLVTGLSYETATPWAATDEETWGAQLVATHVAAQDRVNDPATFRPPGYTLFDLLGHVSVTRNATLNAGVRNLFDRKSFQYLDVVGLSPTRSDLDRYAQPGRTFFVSASLRW